MAPAHRVVRQGGTGLRVESALCNLTLWHAAGVEVPPELLRALAKRPGARVTLAGDPFMALAEICLAARSGPETNARLVILFPEMLTDTPEFCAIADTYAPSVPRWLYGPASNPQLRAIVEEDVMQWMARQAPPVTPAPEIVVRPAAIRDAERALNPPALSSRTGPAPAVPQLRLAGDGPVLDNAPNSADAKQELAVHESDRTNAADAASAHLITDEELRMLLGESTPEGQQEPQ